MSRSFGFSFLACCVVFVSVIGCQKRSAGVNPAESVRQAMVDKHVTGCEISAECIVTFFDSNGSRYVSQQQHTIYPEDSAIIIKATEPEGDYEWVLLNGVFTVAKGDSSKLPVTVCSNEIAQVIVLSISASGGYLGDKAGELFDPVSIAGRIYRPIVIYGGDNPSITKKVYRDASSFEIDWVEIANSSNNTVYAARNYNIRNLSETDKLMPTSIDIYDTDKDGRPSDCIMKIEYKSFGIVSQ